jgi:hypothetical protein
MSRRWLFVVLLLLCDLGLPAMKVLARDDIPRAVVESGKRATVFVETKEATGTAFCIDADGVFVTNQHVVGSNTRVTLILNSGEQDQRVVSATVVERDAKLDLALLKAEGAGPWKPVPLAPSASGLIETTSLVAFGFPYGKDLAVDEGHYPSITVSTGRVTALRKDQGVLVGIQLDASLTPGSSGGPVLDQQGRVIGIVEKGIEGAGINFAIPVDHLQFLLLRPHITLNSSIIPRAKAHLPNTLRFQVASWNGQHRGYQVTFTLDPHTDHARNVPVQSAGGSSYTATMVPLPQQAPSAKLRLVVTGVDGTFVATTPEREITVGTRKVPLSEVASIANGPSPSIHLRNGTTLSGAIAGLTDVPVALNGVAAKVDLTQGQVITITEPSTSMPSLHYELVARLDGNIVAEMAGILEIEKDPNQPTGETPQTVVPEPQAEGQINGSLSFRAPIVLTVPGMKFFTGLRLADLDGDGHLDILVTSGTDLVVLYGHGDGTTFDMIRYPMAASGGQIRVADLNHDGRLDVVVNGGPGVQVLLSTGNRKFAPARTYATGDSSSCIAVGDFNGDGSPDLAVTNLGSSNFAVLLNRGDGTFGPATTYPTPQYTIGIAAADFNGDGKLDLAVNCFYSGGTQIFLGDGKGGFRQSSVSPETGGGQLIVADFNGDGHLDLAGVNYWSSGLGVALGDGKGDFAVSRIGTNQYPSQMCVGDIDGDGRPDILFGNQGTNSFTVCLNAGDGKMLEGLRFTVADGDVHGAVCGDLNEDGMADIVADGGGEHLFIFLNNAKPPPNRKKSAARHP